MRDEAAVRRLADRTGVEQDQVGLAALGRLAVAERLEHPLHPLRVVLVHLAAEGREVIAQMFICRLHERYAPGIRPKSSREGRAGRSGARRAGRPLTSDRRALALALEGQSDRAAHGPLVLTLTSYQGGTRQREPVE